MMELTKERLTALSNRENVGAICSDEIVAMARQLLAGLEQEPVAWVTMQKEFCDDERTAITNRVDADRYSRSCYDLTPLYAAPQLPQPAVVPDLKELEATIDWILMLPCPTPKATHFAKRLAVVIDNCRAAMLQSAEPVSQPYTLREGLAAIRNLGPIDAGKIQAERDALNEPDVPDGYALVSVDMTPEQMRAVQLNSELGAYAAANLSGAYSLFREFWDVAVKSAPNQEAK